MIDQFRSAYPEAILEEERLTEETALAIPEVREQQEQLSSWDWCYGESPKFSLNITHRFEWGICDLYIDWEHGVVKRSKLYSDALSPDLIAALQQGVDAQLNAQVACEAVAALPQLEQQIDEFFDWVRKELLN
jgi:lipoate-protein ligase A